MTEENFRESIPSEFREHPSMEGFKDMGAFVKSHVELVGKLGTRPKTWADLDAPTDAEGRNAAYARLGRPDSPDGYKIPADATGGSEFRNAAHKANLSSEQADLLFAEIAVNGKTMKETQQKEWDDGLAEDQKKIEEQYKGKWGDQYETEKATTASAMEKHLPELRKELENVGLHNHPELIDLMNSVGKSMTEDSMFGNTDGGGTGTDSLETVSKKRAEMQGDEKVQKILNDHMHPEHERVAKEFQALMSEEANLATKGGTVPGWGPEAA